MADDNENWFTRQASRTTEDIKQLPEWLRTQREGNKQLDKQNSAVPDNSKNAQKSSA